MVETLTSNGRAMPIQTSLRCRDMCKEKCSASMTSAWPPGSRPRHVPGAFCMRQKNVCHKCGIGGADTLDDQIASPRRDG